MLAGLDLRATYLTLDRRVLGAFRIWFGGVLLFDLARRSLDATLLYSNDGVLSNHFQIWASPYPIFSVYLPFSTPTEVHVAFALTAVVYLAYLVGYRTRLAQIAAFVCVTSLNARNIAVEDGGCAAMNLVAAWTLFLPLGDRFSIDAVARALGRDPRLPDPARDPRAQSYVSVVALALAVEIAVIYAMNAIHKDGPTWRHGSAVHYILWQARFDTWLAAWLRHHEPGFFSPFGSYATLAFESIAPLMVLVPRRSTDARILFFVGAVAFHLSIAALMTLGPFSYAMIALDALILPGDVPDAIGGWLRSKIGTVALRFDPTSPGALRLVALLRAFDPLGRLEISERPGPLDVGHPLLARLVAVVGRWWGSAPALFETPTSSFVGPSRLHEVAAVALLVLLLADAGVDNPKLHDRLGYQLPRWARLAVEYPRLHQSWNMFAPDVPVEDGIVVIDAVTADGRHIDPFTGGPPVRDAILQLRRPYSAMVCDYLPGLHEAKDHRELRRFLAHWHEATGRPASDRLVSFEAWWVTYDAPKRGSEALVNVKQERFLDVKL